MPHAQTDVSPAELFLGRKLRAKLDLLIPVGNINKKSLNQEIETRVLKINDRVIARNYVRKNLVESKHST